MALCARAEYEFSEPFEKVVPFKADGVFSIENVNGDVTVRAWDRNEISIKGEKRAETDEELKKIDVEMDLSDSHAHIKTHLPKRSGWFSGQQIHGEVRYIIMLPATAVVDAIKCVNSGTVVEGMRGKVRVDLVNGSVNAHGLGGDVHLKTVNGGIHADFASIGSDQDLRLSSVNGSITARLPQSVGASIHADTVNGGISTDFPLTVTGRFIGRHVDGTVGDGKASIRANTVNGGITFKRA